MNVNTKEYVIGLLEGYTDSARKIALLRYELEHPALITPDEMIDALSFAKGTGEGHAAGHISNKTMYIAMNYQNETAHANSEIMDDITVTLMPMEREADRLHHYISLLEEREQIILKQHYFERRSWEEIGKAVPSTPKTLRKIMDVAVSKLCEMYSFTTKFQDFPVL